MFLPLKHGVLTCSRGGSAVCVDSQSQLFQCPGAALWLRPHGHHRYGVEVNTHLDSFHLTAAEAFTVPPQRLYSSALSA